MTTTALETAPYAPPQNVLDVLHHVRKRKLPEMFDVRVLTSIGIPNGNVSRTLATLRFLHLTDEDNRCQVTFERLARATDEEYPEQLAQVIREAYKTVFTYVDPAEDDSVKLNNVFRQHYDPQAQRARMVTLFVALCRQAGIITGAQSEPRPRARRATTPLKESGQRQGRSPRVAQPSDLEQRHLPNMPPAQTMNSAMFDGLDSDDHYALCFEMLRKLPPEHRWTRKQRARWLQAIAANVDLLVEIEDEDGVKTREMTVVEADEVPF